MKRKTVYGEVEGLPFRAHFEGNPSAADIEALEELVRAVKLDFFEKSSAPENQSCEECGTPLPYTCATPLCDACLSKPPGPESESAAVPEATE